jgi:hypothetical protein
VDLPSGIAKFEVNSSERTFLIEDIAQFSFALGENIDYR